MTLIFFVLIFGTIVLAHEFGHYLLAKVNGIHVVVAVIVDTIGESIVQGERPWVGEVGALGRHTQRVFGKKFFFCWCFFLFCFPFKEILVQG